MGELTIQEVIAAITTVGVPGMMVLSMWQYISKRLDKRLDQVIDHLAKLNANIELILAVRHGGN